MSWLHAAREFREKYLTESDVYPEALAEFKIEREIPDAADEKGSTRSSQGVGHGVFLRTSRLYSTKSQRNCKTRGCDAVYSVALRYL